jgi:hypothetical protein
MARAGPGSPRGSNEDSPPVVTSQARLKNYKIHMAEDQHAGGVNPLSRVCVRPGGLRGGRDPGSQRLRETRCSDSVSRKPRSAAAKCETTDVNLRNEIYSILRATFPTETDQQTSSFRELILDSRTGRPAAEARRRPPVMARWPDPVLRASSSGINCLGVGKLRRQLSSDLLGW